MPNQVQVSCGQFKKTTEFTETVKTTDLRCILKIILLESFQELCEVIFQACYMV